MLKHRTANMIYINYFPGLETCLSSAIFQPPCTQAQVKNEAADVCVSDGSTWLCHRYSNTKNQFSGEELPCQLASRAAQCSELLWNSSSDLAAFLLCGRIFSHQLFLWHVFAYNTIPTTKHPLPLSISYGQDRSDNTIVLPEQNQCFLWYICR